MPQIKNQWNKCNHSFLPSWCCLIEAYKLEKPYFCDGSVKQWLLYFLWYLPTWKILNETACIRKWRPTKFSSINPNSSPKSGWLFQLTQSSMLDLMYQLLILIVHAYLICSQFLQHMVSSFKLEISIIQKLYISSIACQFHQSTKTISWYYTPHSLITCTVINFHCCIWIRICI